MNTRRQFVSAISADGMSELEQEAKTAAELWFSEATLSKKYPSLYLPTKDLWCNIFVKGYLTAAVKK
jgi:hypothetical protein